MFGLLCTMHLRTHTLSHTHTHTPSHTHTPPSHTHTHTCTHTHTVTPSHTHTLTEPVINPTLAAVYDEPATGLPKSHDFLPSSHDSYHHTSVSNGNNQNNNVATNEVIGLYRKAESASFSSPSRHHNITSHFTAAQSPGDNNNNSNAQ